MRGIFLLRKNDIFLLKEDKAMKQQLAKKKEAQSSGKQGKNGLASNQRMQSQQTKKPSNTRRKMGS